MFIINLLFLSKVWEYKYWKKHLKSDVTIKSGPKSVFQNSLNTPNLCI